MNSLAASLHARSAIPLESAALLSQVGAPPDQNSPYLNVGVGLYVATPRLLAAYGIKASQIAPGTDILTVRPLLTGLSQLQMTWQSSGSGGQSDGSQSGANGGPSCTLSNDCLASPAIQKVSDLPSGTAAPSTVITEYAVRKYHVQAQLTGWLIQAPAPLTARQIRAARQVTLAYQAPLEIPSGGTDFGEIADVGTALGILIALGVLAASLVWAHASLSALFGDVPVPDVLILLIGLPLVATVVGWLLAGREPPLLARQPIE